MKSSAPASFAAATHSSSVASRLPVADVVHDGSGEQVRLLEDDTERAAQVGFLYLVDIYSVVANLSVRYIVETG